MSSTQVALLGAIAGLTIYLGLPLGRVRASMPRLKAGLNAVAIGILLFLLWDVLSQAWEPVDQALGDSRVGTAVGDGVVLAA
jgi:ZIP family zinc transporter